MGALVHVRVGAVVPLTPSEIRFYLTRNWGISFTNRGIKGATCAESTRDKNFEFLHKADPGNNQRPLYIQY